LLPLEAAEKARVDNGRVVVSRKFWGRSERNCIFEKERGSFVRRFPVFEACILMWIK
jgi:hypothetical protein